MSKTNLKNLVPVNEQESVNCLAENVQCAMRAYFKDLDGYKTNELYALFMEEVEKPFFEVVMEYTKGNITQAAQMLGLNRVTIRNRLKKYELD